LKTLVGPFQDAVQLSDQFQELLVILFYRDQGAQLVDAIALCFIHRHRDRRAGNVPKRSARLWEFLDPQA
jgi:hypothetical protein